MHPPLMIKLTARQEQILNLIKDAIENTGFPPTRAEIANELGFKSANAAEEHLQALARKGVIELVSGTSRGIRLRGDTVRSINAARGSQFSLPIPGLSQLVLPLVGRVAAGSPILAQEHVDQTYSVENSLFQHKPDYLLKVRGMSMRDAGIMDGDLLAVQYPALPTGLRGHTEKIEQAVQTALSAAEEQLTTIDWTAYDRVFFLSKSIGTAIAARYAVQHNIHPRQVYYTPIEQALPYLDPTGIAFHGTADPWADTEMITNGCRKIGIPLYLTENANHSMETGDTLHDIFILHDIMDETAH